MTLFKIFFGLEYRMQGNDETHYLNVSGGGNCEAISDGAGVSL
jgi:hypothetical protein